MKRILKIAAAASILLTVGLITWTTIGGGSGNRAFAAVAEALDSLRSATFDISGETKGIDGKPPTTSTGKGFFLAPSHQRTEYTVGSGKETSSMIMIMDSQGSKCLMLMPSQKVAMTMDMEKLKENIKKTGNGSSPDLFETVRRFAREGGGSEGEKVEKLGKKEIDGRAAIGFRIHNNIGEMTYWADPETSRPVRIEMSGEMFADIRMVMSNFRYDEPLNPSLFSLEPPEGYSSQTMNLTLPVEEDLAKTLRKIAEYNKGRFPDKLGMTKEIMEPLMAILKPEMDKFEAEHGLKLKPGEQPPPALMAEAMKVMLPLMQKEMGGIMFFMMLKPENDSHYTGGGVKLGTPDRPIFWYKPTGAEKYRVLYADLTFKEMTKDEAAKLSVKDPAKDGKK